jgi:hypothetical protein
MGNLAHAPTVDSIWLFGTCFTWSYGCRPQFQYYKEYKQENDLRWTQIIGQKYQCLIEMRATPALGTNFGTIKSLTKELLNIKPNDIAIIELVRPYGILRPNLSGTKIEDFGTWNIDWDKHWKGWPEEDKKIGIGYWEQFIKGKEEAWMKYFVEHVEMLRGILHTRGVKTVLWHSEWEGTSEEFERIRDHTNGEIDDFHYSWKGHRQVADYLINKIDNKEFFNRPLV